MLLSPPCDDDSEADTLVMARAMTLLSLQVDAPIIVEIQDKDNLVVVRKMMQQQHLDRRIEQQVHPIAGDDLVGSALIQAAFQPVSTTLQDAN
eukprot:SAG31_NODE_15242_length_764_cov_0.800000_1_plen_92_part_10